ncbi:hypothetical protein J6590_022770 [Homalodisca vitripennis]|nr:hypothetical protein J6590_022770 [Homalodisca vitripennis]
MLDNNDQCRTQVVWNTAPSTSLWNNCAGSSSCSETSRRVEKGYSAHPPNRQGETGRSDQRNRPNPLNAVLPTALFTYYSFVSENGILGVPGERCVTFLWITSPCLLLLYVLRRSENTNNDVNSRVFKDLLQHSTDNLSDKTIVATT